MTQTTNYRLNIVEGTDIVNPLVQMNPNFQTIDAEMKANKDSAISAATEIKSGTVHAITRVNGGSAVFRFTATSDFETGETFTVDGVQVTALYTDGTPLTTGAFVINSNVLCVLIGTLMTVFASRAGGTIASDSERLGGNLPNYYATAESVAQANQAIQNVSTVALNALPASSAANFLRVVSFDASTGTLTTAQGVG